MLAAQNTSSGAWRFGSGVDFTVSGWDCGLATAFSAMGSGLRDCCGVHASNAMSAARKIAEPRKMIHAPSTRPAMLRFGFMGVEESTLRRSAPAEKLAH